MSRSSKRKTHIKKLEACVDNVKKKYMSSIVFDDEDFDSINYLNLLQIGSYQKMHVVTSKWCLFRNERHVRFTHTISDEEALFRSAQEFWENFMDILSLTGVVSAGH